MRTIQFITILLFLFLTTFSHTYGEEIQPKIVNEITTDTKKNDYILPFPGMLPNNPLYILKVIRDKFIENLISDPEIKIAFHLMQADKQIGMINNLINDNNVNLAIKTALKAEDNNTKITIIYKFSHIKPTLKMKDALILSAKKHQEILSEIIKKVKNNDKKTFNQIMEFSKINEQEIIRIYNSFSIKRTETENPVEIITTSNL